MSVLRLSWIVVASLVTLAPVARSMPPAVDQPGAEQRLLGTVLAQSSVAMEPEVVKKIVASAEKGDPASQNQLGMMYENGEGVPQDFSKAGKVIQPPRTSWA
jgi:hypothetical protein